MKQSPAFSSFRSLMDIWDENTIIENKKKADKQSKVKSIIDGKNLIMFFKKGNSLFGAPEESRIVYAQMRNPDDDWMASDANFSAFDLIQALNGNSTENVFSMNDLPQIDIITRDEAEDSLMKCPCQQAVQPADLEPTPADKFGIGMIKLKDRE